jgi:hypothetical protein
VWTAFLVAQPLYVLPTGLPQPGDLLLLPLLGIVLAGWDGRLGRDAMRVLKALLVFTVWVAIVDYGWAALDGNWVVFGREGMLMYPLYYIYNFLLMFAALVLHRQYGDYFLRVTMAALFVTLVVLVAASMVLPGANSGRGKLFFANPNQLGYHALLCGCIITLAYRHVGWSSLRAGICLSACAYLSFVSASRSALAGIAVLVVLLTVSNLKVIIATGIAALLALQLGGPLARGIDATEQRMLNPRSPEMTFFEQRGYDRLANNKQYLLLGAGEGATHRFEETTAFGGGEIHSSGAMLLFCYGIVGVVLFGAFLFRLVRGARLRAGMILIPPLMYTFAHQGLRFSLLWVMVAMFVAVKASNSLPDIVRTRRSPAPRPTLLEPT